MRRIRTAGFLLLLVLSATAAAATTAPYRCTHGELWANRSGPPPGATLAEHSSGGGGAFHSHVADLSEWKGLRVATSFEDLNLPGKFCASAGDIVPDFRRGKVICGQSGILTTERRQLLVGTIVPAAVKLHTERLSVIPVEGTLKVRMLTAAVMHYECDAFTVPAQHKTDGAGVNADFVLYVASAPAPSFGSTCAFQRRPVAGVMNFETPLISATRFSIRIAAHEIAHTLGFSSYGSKQLGFVESETRADGSAIFRTLTSPSVKRAVRKHYGCASDADAIMPLEGKDWESFNASGTHWSRYGAKDELMAPRMDPAGGFYSALTLAFFDDLPYYQADLSKAEPMRWGMGLGCGFLRETCRRGDGAVARPEMHCSIPSATLQCAYSRLALGTCEGAPATPNKLLREAVNRMVTYDGEAGPEYCAAVVATPATSCIEGDDAQMPGSVVGPESRCLRAEAVVLRGAGANTATRDICANIQCDAGSRRLRVQLKGSPAWHECSGTLNLAASPEFTSGRVQCPDYDEVCPHVPLRAALKASADATAAPATTAHAALLAVAAALALTICIG